MRGGNRRAFSGGTWKTNSRRLRYEERRRGGAVALVGIGLITVGLSNFAIRADATPAATVNVGPEESRILWYESHAQLSSGNPSAIVLARAWPDGTIEARCRGADPRNNIEVCLGIGSCGQCPAMFGWLVISRPNEGLNAAADINSDSHVNAENLGIMLAAWGDAPRNDYPPSDCHLDLIP